MISKVDLHFRSSPAEDHRNFGVVAVEHDGAAPAPHQDIACHLGQRRITARITSIHQRGSHLPHVYADAMHEDELV